MTFKFGDIVRPKVWRRDLPAEKSTRLMVVGPDVGANYWCIVLAPSADGKRPWDEVGEVKKFVPQMMELVK